MRGRDVIRAGKDGFPDGFPTALFDKLGDPLMKSGVLLVKTFLATLANMAAAFAIDSDIQNK